jgi:small subunit ribosomal protein S6
MHLTEYETTVVMRPDLGGDAVEAALDRVREVVRTGGGKLLGIDHWGKRKLAYPMAKQARGIYVHTHYLGGSGLVAELERNLRISDSVLRYLTIRLASHVDPNEREEKAYVAPQYDADEVMMHDEEPRYARAGSDDDVDGDDRPRRGDSNDDRDEAPGAAEEE